MKWAVFILILTVLFISCEREQAPKPSATATVCNDSLANGTIHFATQIAPILQTYCINREYGDCHQSGSSLGYFTYYGGIEPYASSGQLYYSVVILKSMPSSTSRF